MVFFSDTQGNTAITEFFVLKTSLCHNTQRRFAFVIILKFTKQY